ncbi:hypothetical protein IT072_06640 [Leifsonia sp. ZF2019]|uniref:hypothetical protein n=1 Tax=Leifsonia sp. ZF2019 TaxID=2781978 RepID=UPI001CBA7E95|nr:hypothetical protein [Leifsonia sp. ZF2019]UAJ80684.1 hypothetical protein IT072_06640 [Leifsonia sp. ZF2019]
MITLIVAAFNMRKISSFIANATRSEPKDPKVRRCDREHYNPDTGRQKENRPGDFSGAILFRAVS